MQNIYFLYKKIFNQHLMLTMMKKRYLFVIFMLCFITKTIAQELNVPKASYVRQDSWNASWITHPQISLDDYNVVLFRKTFDLTEVSGQFIVHVTADNRYRLYVNGTFICFGPQLSDMRHWRYETIDIAKYLKVGKNVIAAEVVNWGPDCAFGIISKHTGFLMQGYSDKEKIVNTEDHTWKTFSNKAYHPKEVRWMMGLDIIGGFYASNPTDSVNANLYPWGWQSPSYNDASWEKAKWLNSASAWGGSFAWILQPRTTPLLVDSVERLKSIVRTTGISVDNDFLKGKKFITIPANTNASFIIDQTYETVGYPEIILSGGKDANIHIGYAENLYSADRTKGNRNDIKGKHFIGIRDVYVPDGGIQRLFRPLYHRSFRFIQVEIQTKDEPLILNDFYNVFTAAPLQLKSKFKSDNPKYDKLFDICWRTTKICTQDNLMSDAYYEQMMYVGDSHVQNMTNLSLTGDTLHFRNAIEQFAYSRLPDGMITSCYPLKGTFVHPTFSLIWIDMLHDYFMYCNDKAFIRLYLPAINLVFDYFEKHKNKNGIPGKSEWPYFVDWYEPLSGGTAPMSVDGNSATITLHYVYTLQHAAELFQFYGLDYEANLYKQRADELKKIVLDLFYDKKTGMVMENPEKTYFDQHSNIMAVLTGLVPPADQQRIIRTILTDTTYSRAGFYYRFNLFDALKKSHTGDYFDEAAQLWYDFIDLGLTTTPEAPTNIRSECHPWSTAPAYAFFHVICGIEPAEPGFNKISIAPELGKLNFIDASYPHRLGNVLIHLKRKGTSGVQGEVVLPEKLTGTFSWYNHNINLKEGKNVISL
jgi:alpha-L-rhamnosidase